LWEVKAGDPTLEEAMIGQLQFLLLENQHQSIPVTRAITKSTEFMNSN
jgi:hypothetical protein